MFESVGLGASAGDRKKLSQQQHRSMALARAAGSCNGGFVKVAPSRRRHLPESMIAWG
jgi:hypothetical protein